MKQRSIIRFLTVLVPLLASAVWADHSSPLGSVGRLLAESEDLEQLVSRSSLHYGVKDAVSRFARDVERLADCVRYGGERPIFHGHLDDPGCPSQCSSVLYRVQSSLRTVARYLWDTQYDYPAVYECYREVQQALDRISVSGGGPIDPFPGPSSVQCIAVDRGWEEHGGGHVGIGRTNFEAERSALLACERYHGRCRIQSCRTVR